MGPSAQAKKYSTRLEIDHAIHHGHCQGHGAYSKCFCGLFLLCPLFPLRRWMTVFFAYASDNFFVQICVYRFVLCHQNYLHLFKPPVLHRDLKTPNLLVNTSLSHAHIYLPMFLLCILSATCQLICLGTCHDILFRLTKTLM